MANVFREYLIKLGFKSDNRGFNDANEKLSKISEKLGLNSEKVVKFANSFLKSAKNVSSAVSIVYTALVETNGAIIEFLNNEAKLDLDIERTARKFWAAESSVRAYQYSLEALGENEGDLYYMTDEQYDRFLKLNTLAKSIDAPGDVDNTLRKIRDIQFEFSKIKLLLAYLKRWITYYIGIRSKGTIERTRQQLSKLGEWLQDNIPKIANVISKSADTFLRYGEAAMHLISGIANLLKNALPESAEGMAGSMIRIFEWLATALLGGSVGKIIAALWLLLALIDDYQTWARGGESLFNWGPLKQGIEDTSQSIENAKKEIVTLWGAITGKNSWDDYLATRSEGIARGMYKNFKFSERIGGTPWKSFGARQVGIFNKEQYDEFMSDPVGYYNTYKGFTNTQNNNISINISGANNPDETAGEVREVLQDIIGNVNMNTGFQ